MRVGFGLAVADPFGAAARLAVGLVLGVVAGPAHAPVNRANRPIPIFTASIRRAFLFVLMQLLMKVALSATLAFTAIVAGFVPSSVALAAVHTVSGHVTDASTAFIYEVFGQ